MTSVLTHLSEAEYEKAFCEAALEEARKKVAHWRAVKKVSEDLSLRDDLATFNSYASFVYHFKEMGVFLMAENFDVAEINRNEEAILYRGHPLSDIRDYFKTEIEQ